MHAQHLGSDALPPAQLDRRRNRQRSGHHHRPSYYVHHVSNNGPFSCLPFRPTDRSKEGELIT